MLNSLDARRKSFSGIIRNIFTTGSVQDVQASPAGALQARVAPAFGAYASASQAISSVTFTKVTLDTEIYDTNNYFASNRFTPLIAGYYDINATLRAGDTVAVTAVLASIYKNGSEYTRLGQLTNQNATSTLMVSGNKVIYFNGITDYVELYGYISGTSPSFDFASIAASSQMSGAYLRP